MLVVVVTVSVPVVMEVVKPRESDAGSNDTPLEKRKRIVQSSTVETIDSGLLFIVF